MLGIGKYQPHMSPLRLQHLDRWNWEPVYFEQDSIKELDHGQVKKVIVGGRYNLSVTDVKIDAKRFDPSHVLLILSSQIGRGSVQFNVSESGESMSILLAGPDETKYRYLDGPEQQQLTNWFADHEERAWFYANSQPNKPKYIFYVKGQRLVSDYAISHVEGMSSTSSVSLEVDGGIPEKVDVGFFLKREVKRIFADAGFDCMEKIKDGEKTRLYCVFLEVDKSYPTRFGSSTQYAKVRDIRP